MKVGRYHSSPSTQGRICDLWRGEGWVDDYDFLEQHKIDEAIPWALLKGNDFGMMSVQNAKAREAGLTFRPLATTVRDTLAWWLTVPDARRMARARQAVTISRSPVPRATRARRM